MREEGLISFTGVVHGNTVFANGCEYSAAPDQNHLQFSKIETLRFGNYSEKYFFIRNSVNADGYTVFPFFLRLQKKTLPATTKSAISQPFVSEKN
ncbi:hypothetical protein BC643_0314 [Mangrovibacterium diazotrophicum]|uniref:Uncharacterized protein n=1 Tax=Mangrovibacterium diazotrophicum TaxID=1261403 RepID=A0A419W3T8_9BACT|nr:hypothetical protein BC643_0314 [Mangrovibacterium diazotrophicum]